MNSLCNDCKNTSCPMQSGIKRIECAFHIPTNKSGYVPLETVFDLTEYMCRDCHSNCKECILAEPLELLKNMEPADARPVVRGKWIRGNESRTSPTKDSYICSVCGEKTLSGFCGNPEKTNFCPNCGADCRGGNDGK